MKTSFTGTIVNGMVQLDQPIGLADQSRVQVTLVPLSEGEQQFQRALDALDELRRTHPIDSGGLRYTRDQLYERD